VDWQAIGVSVRLALATTLILLVVAVPVAAWLTYSRRRWMVLVEALVALPLVLPPTVLGYYVLVAMGNRSPAGRWWQELTGSSLAFSFEGLLVASVLYSLPFAVQPLLAAFAGVDRRLLEASEILGRGSPGTVWRVVLPLCRPGLATSAVLTFAHTVGEFGVVLMVGGNIPGETRTVSVSVYDDVQAFDYAAAGRTSLALLCFSLVVLTAVYSLQRGAGTPWQRPLSAGVSSGEGGARAPTT
jgi:molybdate transport system permease protein